MIKKQNLRAQGTIEYLVIIGIVIVIGLAVTMMLTGFLGGASEISENQSIMHWRSASPFAITDSAFDVGTNTLYLVFHSKEKLNYFNIGMDQNNLSDTGVSPRNIVRQINLSKSLSDITIGDRLVVIPKDLIFIEYDTRYIESQSQRGQQDLIVRRMD